MWKLFLVIYCCFLAASRGEDPECPCIDPWTESGGLPLEFSHWEGNRRCLSYRSSPGEQPLCYPTTYGAEGCAAYDTGLPPDCMEDGTALTAKRLPTFCGDPWCYVDKNNCKLDVSQADYFSGLNLSYSYATCNSVNAFHGARLAESLKGRTLQVGVPGMEPPFLFKDHTGRYNGISPDFLAYIASYADLKLEFKPVYNDSRAIYPQSSYTACVRDVALGRFDLCTGIFWETPQRRALSQFSPLLFPDLFSLVVFKQEKAQDLGTQIYRVFMPFSWDLWLVVISFSFVVGLVLWLLGEYDNKNNLSAIAMSTELAVLKFLGQTGWGRLKTVGSGFVATGFGFVCMVSMASYMANTAAMLVSSHVAPVYDNIEDAFMQGAKICVLEPLKGPLLGKYSLADESFVYVGWFDEAIMKMDAGQCDAVLLNDNEYSRMQGGVDYYGTSPGGKTAHCNKIRVGGIVLTMPASMPLQKDIAFAASYLTTTASVNGAWQSATREHTMETNVCKYVDEKEVRSLTSKDLSGALIVASVLVIVGLFVHYVEPRLERYFCNQVHRLEHRLEKRLSHHSSKTDVSAGTSKTQAEAAPEINSPPEVVQPPPQEVMPPSSQEVTRPAAPEINSPPEVVQPPPQEVIPPFSQEVIPPGLRQRIARMAEDAARLQKDLDEMQQEREHICGI